MKMTHILLKCDIDLISAAANVNSIVGLAAMSQEITRVDKIISLPAFNLDLEITRD